MEIKKIPPEKFRMIYVSQAKPVIVHYVLEVDVIFCCHTDVSWLAYFVIEMELMNN